MERELLYKLFDGSATLEEKEAIMQWVKINPEHKQLFLKERRIYNAILIQGVCPTGEPVSEKRHFPLWQNPYFLKLAQATAVILITLGLNNLWQNRSLSGETVAMQTISVPAGQCVNVTLPDGSDIWLNAGTTIQYPVSFNTDKRLVTLDGEAYFDIARNPEKPFVVKTARFDIEVLGTKFNVDAYAGMDKFETVLMEGHVMVSSIADPSRTVALQPNRKVYSRNADLLTTEVNNFERYRWKEGLICFQNEPFDTVMKDFERFYGLRIVVHNQKVMKYLYTGKFKQTDGIEHALRLLQKNIYFTYQRDSEHHIIYINE